MGYAHERFGVEETSDWAFFTSESFKPFSDDEGNAFLGRNFACVLARYAQALSRVAL